MKIGIVSLGLIGGSLYKKLSEYSYEIYAVTRNKDTINQIKKYSGNISDDISILKSCEVVFVASPINKTVEILDKLEKVVSKDCIVLDCASVKEFVMKKERPYKFIGSHPMAGTEFQGFKSSFKELFEGAKWVLTPSKNIDENSVELVKSIIKKTGAEVIITNAGEHDKAAALISHMPLLVSQALFYCVQNNKLALELASSGFRDMTRLALSNLDMASDIRNHNENNIKFSVNSLIASLQYLENNNNKEIYSKIKTLRAEMYSPDGKNIIN